MRLVCNLILLVSLILIPTLNAQESADTQPTRKLGVVATAHLDTQWRWTVKNTIEEFIPSTLRDNFKLLDIYPDYTFSFEGSFRYMLAKEYYPEDYERLKKYIADGRWRVTGSWVDAVDVNLPSFESLVRHALYGNAFYKEEFGKQSYDIFMPDCFGFGYALPSIARHCGLRSFSTQKLTWGCSVDIPFTVGLWRGVDGSTMLSALRTGSYASQLRDDLSRDTLWVGIIDTLGVRSGCYSAYRYFGTGDTGGAPDSLSVDWLVKSIHSDGPIQIASIGADDLPSFVTDCVTADLPVYDGELIMTRHGVGCYTSQAAMKRWNRRNELLADAAERAAVTASLLGDYEYPKATFNEAWIRFLWHQFHDDLTGTSIPEAYEYSWSDELLSLNQFSSLLTGAMSAITPALDTRAKGLSYVVYNPLAFAREQVVEVPVTDFTHVQVFGPDNKEVPSQLVVDGDGQKVLFLASAPSVGYAVYDIRRTKTDYPGKTSVTVTENMIDNGRYRLTLNENGDVASIYDYHAAREMLAAPIEWQLIFNKPRQWAAWEIQYEDLLAGPRGKVEGTPTIEILESGPVRGAIKITRQHEHSTFVTTIRLASGPAGDRIDFVNDVDWAEKETLLKVAFKPSFANDSVTYSLGLGAIKRGLNTERKYEVPGHPWVDFTSADGSYGLGLMSDCKYGWDHPDSETLRLTLIHTPGVFDSWNWVGDQSTQDIGRHHFTYSITGHKGDWTQSELPLQAESMLQPLIAYAAPSHEGALGKSYSLLRLDGGDNVMINAVKKAEESDEIIVRVRELNGRSADGMRLTFERPIISVREVNGQEEEIGVMEALGNSFGFSLTPYQPKAFAVRLEKSTKSPVPALASQPIQLPYDLDGVSLRADRTDGDIDGSGNSLAGDLLPPQLKFHNVDFTFGSTAPHAKNVVACQSQQIPLPTDNDWSDLYLLMMATGGPAEGSVSVQGASGDVTTPLSLFDYTEPMGQWDNRMVNGQMVTETSDILPAFINQTPVAWAGTHRYNADGQDDIYLFTYLYAQKISLPDGASSFTLPSNPQIKLLAASVAGNQYDNVQPAVALYDTASASLARIQVTATEFIEGDSTLTAINSPTPGATVRYTLDGSEPMTSSPEFDGTFALNESTTIRARAFDNANVGGVTTNLSVKKLVPHLAVTATTSANGLMCSYYEGEWTNLPDFDAETPVSEFVVDSVFIPEVARPEDYGLVFTGFVNVPADGLYEFGISSDDGSNLFVAETLVADNDGIHGDGEVVGKIALKAGLHPIRVNMFQCKGGQALAMYITGPGLDRQEVTSEMLTH